MNKLQGYLVGVLTGVGIGYTLGMMEARVTPRVTPRAGKEFSTISMRLDKGPICLISTKDILRPNGTYDVYNEYGRCSTPITDKGACKCL